MGYSTFTFAGSLPTAGAYVSLSPPTGTNWLIKSYSLYQGQSGPATTFFINGYTVDAAGNGTKISSSDIVVTNTDSVDFMNSATVGAYSLTGVTV